MAEDRTNWLNLADKFAEEGDPRGMRACARELWEGSARGKLEGAAVMAEAALYTNSLDEAASLADEILRQQPGHLRARLVKAGVAAKQFELGDEIPLLRGIVQEAERKRQALDPSDAYYATLVNLLRRARGWLADALYLAADPQGAAENLLARSELAEDDRPMERAMFYSKYLFMRNYREQPVREARRAAEHYAEILPVKPFVHAPRQSASERKLRVGYLSPDFREHAVANFTAPLLFDFDPARFSVHVYHTGRRDAVTKRFQKAPVKWTNLAGRSPRTAARMIYEDQLDILVDLSGHTQGSCLPIMAYRPAPVQVSGIGYMNTTGLPAVDYFLSDEICLPSGDRAAADGFTERILRLPHTHLCYAPDIVHAMPEAGTEAPVYRNGYVTYASFNNFAKLTDTVLLLWRGILEQVPGARLLLKGKTASVPSGQAILRERLRKLNFDLSRVEFRPYSPDYLEQYRDVDIALDTMPYTGGLTTCEALYMGVPVIAMRGRSHGARFGASILQNAGVAELLLENDVSYVRRAVQLGKSPELIGAYHSGLRANLRKSSLMNRKQYMRELEQGYAQIWTRAVESGGSSPDGDI